MNELIKRPYCFDIGTVGTLDNPYIGPSRREKVGLLGGFSLLPTIDRKIFMQFLPGSFGLDWKVKSLDLAPGTIALLDDMAHFECCQRVAASWYPRGKVAKWIRIAEARETFLAEVERILPEVESAEDADLLRQLLK
ncbi:MAG: hypothetical protein J5J00_00190 [Deltaproteobacteria bacterium]|nr:hypothetical protein [Deltaproteobacteria bacterium]